MDHAVLLMSTALACRKADALSATRKNFVKAHKLEETGTLNTEEEVHKMAAEL